jgi:hypothetical protein
MRDLAIALVFIVGTFTILGAWTIADATEPTIEIRHVGGLPVECLEGTAEAFPYAVVRCGEPGKPGKPVAPPVQPSIDEGRQPYGPHERSRPIVRSRTGPA